MVRDEGKRRLNEWKYGAWEDLPDGGRRYSYEMTGRRGWRARYGKEVDTDERAMRFWQEIYDDKGVLLERHEKYPADRGHERLKE